MSDNKLNWVSKQKPASGQSLVLESNVNSVKTELHGIQLKQPEHNVARLEKNSKLNAFNENVSPGSTTRMENGIKLNKDMEQLTKMKQISEMEEESRRERKHLKDLQECSSILQSIEGGRYGRESFRRIFQNKVSFSFNYYMINATFHLVP